jgi:hypothetical protein
MNRRFPVLVGCAALALLVGGRAAAQPPAKLMLPVRTIQLEERPSQILLHDGKLLVSSFQHARLAVYDVASGKRLQHAEFDGYETADRSVFCCPPGEMVLANGRLFVGQIFSEHLLVMDPKSLRVVKRLSLGGEGSLAVVPGGQEVIYASNRVNQFSVIDTTTYTYTTVAYPPGGHGIGTVAVSPDGRYVYLGIQRGGKTPDGTVRPGGNTFVAAYDLATQKYVGTAYLALIDSRGVSDDGAVWKILPAPDGRRVYCGLAQSASALKVLGADDLKVRHHVSFPPAPGNTNQWAHCTELALVRDWLVASDRGNWELAVLDPRTCDVLVRLRYVSAEYEAALARAAGNDAKEALERSRLQSEGPDLTQVLVGDGMLYLCEAGKSRVYVVPVRTFARAVHGVLGGEANRVVRLTFR